MAEDSQGRIVGDLDVEFYSAKEVDETLKDLKMSVIRRDL